MIKKRKHIYVATSKIAGLGIMAGENIKKGEYIFTVRGKLKFKINKNEKDALENPNWVGIKKNYWIDPTKPYKFLNHNCNPNSGANNLADLVALKNIKEGEEITIDYSIIEGDHRWEMNCSCKSKICRRKIKSIQFLPEKIYKKYLPHVSSYFQKMHPINKK